MKKIIYLIIFLLLVLPIYGCGETEKLEAPIISITGNKVSWEKVTNATLYKVNIGLNSYVVEENSYTINVKEIGIYEVSVSSSNEKQTSDVSNKLLYTYVKKEVLNPLEITSNENIVSWNKVDNINCYKVYINNVLYKQTTEQTIDLSNLSSDKNEVYVTYVKDEESPISNKLTIEITQEYYKLSTPVLEVNDNKITWEKIDKAKEYYIYQDFELITITDKLEYEYNVSYGTHQFEVMANASVIAITKEIIVASDKSEKVIVYAPVQKEALDMTKPISMFTVSSNLLPTFENSLMVTGSKFKNTNEVNDAKFLLVKEGNYYRIKLANGLFLTHKKDNEGQDEFYALAKTEGNSQIFDIKKCGKDEFTYIIIPMNNPGYLLCEDNNGGYHQYMEIKDQDGNNSSNQVWMLFNIEADISDDVIEKPILCDLTKPLVMYTKSSSKLFTFNEDNLMVQGEEYNENYDYTNNYVTLIQVGTNYRLKLSDNTYLTYKQVSGKDQFYKQEYVDDNSQIFKFTYENGIYKIEPINHLGFLLCEDDGNGYHQYNDCNVDKQFWVLVNIN